MLIWGANVRRGALCQQNVPCQNLPFKFGIVAETNALIWKTPYVAICKGDFNAGFNSPLLWWWKGGSTCDCGKALARKYEMNRRVWGSLQQTQLNIHVSPPRTQHIQIIIMATAHHHFVRIWLGINVEISRFMENRSQCNTWNAECFSFFFCARWNILQCVSGPHATGQ